MTTTLQQKLGFQDGDLGTEKHDAIMLWLNDNAKAVLEAILPHDTDWPSNEKRWAEQQNIPGPLPLYPGFDVVVESTDWEQPVCKDRSTFMIGFIDMVIGYRIPSLHVTTSDNRKTFGIYGVMEKAAIEVKSSIRSIGEVIRQINMYKQGTIHYDQCHTFKWIVVCPQAGLEQVFNSQGILYYQCPSSLA